MARRKLAKTLVFSLLWATFLSLLITNWDTLKSVSLQDLWATIKMTEIGELLLEERRIYLLVQPHYPVSDGLPQTYSKAQIGQSQSDEEDWQEHDEFMQAVKRDCDPAYSSLGGNIHHKSTFDKDWEWKNLDP